MKAGKLALCVGANANIKTSEMLWRLGTPTDECMAEPESSNVPKNGVGYWKRVIMALRSTPAPSKTKNHFPAFIEAIFIYPITYFFY